jgi:hypothetical protein
MCQCYGAGQPGSQRPDDLLSWVACSNRFLLSHATDHENDSLNIGGGHAPGMVALGMVVAGSQSTPISNKADAMPVGFHGKFCTVVEGELHTGLIQSLVKATASHPVSDVPLSHLDHYLDTNGWFGEGREPTLRAIAVHCQQCASETLGSRERSFVMPC